MAILGIVSIGFLGGMSFSSHTANAADQMDTGRAIAQSQMEWVKSQTFSTGGYTPNTSIMAQYPGYSASIAAVTAAERDSSIQKVTITVSRGTKVVAQLQDCKVKK